MTRESRSCPICDAGQAEPRYLNLMAMLDGLDMSYRVARCASCHFVFADQLPSTETYRKYYRSLSKYDLVPSTAGTSPAEQLRCAATVSLLREHAAPNARIADLGCGSGTLLAALRSAGWSRLVGLDPAPGAPAQAAHQFGLDCVRSGTLAQAPELVDLPAMDAVCLTGVLEHLPQLRSDMETLVSSIGNDTRILVEVPALERFTARPFEAFAEFSLEHIQYFSAASLTRLFQTLGFAPLSLKLVELPHGYCDSLFGVFARHPAVRGSPVSNENDHDVADYVARSESMVRASLSRIAACPAKSLVIYGAGSHTARLLPRLLAAAESRIVGLVDSNPNLHGKRLGTLLVEEPYALERNPEATVVVSSFRGQQAIADALHISSPNPVLTLY